MLKTSRRQLLAFLAALPALPALADIRGRSVIVVGAGVAGLSAADALLRRGADVTVLEARNRIGGRAVTDTTSFEGKPFDLGAGWLTVPDQNPLSPRLESAGIKLNTLPDDVISIMSGRRFNTAQTQSFNDLLDNITNAINTTAERGLQLDRLRPQDLKELLALTLLGANSFGVEFNELDAVDAASGIKGMGGEYIEGGMGKAMAQMFKGIPVKLSTPVTEIDYNNGSVTTRDGSKLNADAIIVTVSTGVLASGKIKFTPALPNTHQKAINSLPMGLVNKIAIEFTSDIFGPSIKPMTRLQAVTSHGSVIDARLKQGNDKLVICTVGGKMARSLEGQSDATSLNYALSSLVDLFGSNLERAYVRGKTSRWNAEPWTMGSFAVAEPGQNSARAALAEPAGRMVFAGEALGGPWVRTLAGAYLSGREAAGKAFALGPGRSQTTQDHVTDMNAETGGDNERAVSPMIGDDTDFDETTVRHARPSR